MQIGVDFSRLLPRVRPGALSRELLVRAARIKDKSAPAYAIDATAGFGEDSFLLAASGYHVIMIEQNQEIAGLLLDGLERGRTDEQLAGIVSRMELVFGDARELMGSPEFLAGIPKLDVVYLDPMFPHKSKSAQAKKKLQFIQAHAELSPENDAELFAAAKATPARKIIVKRPIKAAPLDNQTPSYSLEGKLIRFDCYAC